MSNKSGKPKFDPIELGIQRGASQAIDRHKRLGQSIVVWRDGKVVTIPAEDIVVPPYPSDDQLDAS